jgi:MarR family transcriptional regulator, organic hydroperoxide resistance regulator
MGRNTKQVAEIVDNIRRVFQVINEQSKRVKRQTGLTSPQLWTIKAIADAENINVKDLAHRIYLHPVTVVGILDRLEEKGFVVRSRSKEDRRVVGLRLTNKGKQLVANSPEVVQGMLVSGLEKLTKRQLEVIDNGLAELVKMLGIEALPPKLILSSEVNLPEQQVKSKK